VLLIDVHDEVVIENWRQLKEIVGDLPVIAIGEQSVAGATVWVKRSQIATKLLDTLDTLQDSSVQQNSQSTASTPDTTPDTMVQKSEFEGSRPENSTPASTAPSFASPGASSTANSSAPNTEATPSTDSANVSASATAPSGQSDSGNGVLFVAPETKPLPENSKPVEEKKKRILPYAFGNKAKKKESVQDVSADSPKRSDDAKPSDAKLSDATPLGAKTSDAKPSDDASPSAQAKSTEAEKQLNEAKNELKRDNNAEKPVVSEKERLDNELSSVIRQIRESTARGEGGVVVDNAAPDAPAESLSVDPAKATQPAIPPAAEKKTPLPGTPLPDLRNVASGQNALAGSQQQSAAREAGSWPRNIVTPENSKHKSRFLIVDDSSYVWTQLRICLENCPADLDFVSTAEDGVEEVKKRPYDLVFMDVMLPGMNGYDACKQIKKDKQSKHVPVIMLTGRSAPANKLKGVLSGCNYYMTKPVAEAEVRAVVDRFFTRVMKKSA